MRWSGASSGPRPPSTPSSSTAVPAPGGSSRRAAALPTPGWVGVDNNAPADTFWHADTYRAANLDPAQADNHAWWCGAVDYPSCAPGDPEGGYGNDWDQVLNWSGAPADLVLPVTVNVKAVLNHDNEPGYDYLYLQSWTPTGWLNQPLGTVSATWFRST